MVFIKADLEKEREELNQLISGDEDARKAHQEFQARVALREREAADSDEQSPEDDTEML